MHYGIEFVSYRRVRLHVGDMGFVEREWILIYFEGMFIRAYVSIIRDSEFGGDGLPFRECKDTA